MPESKMIDIAGELLRRSSAGDLHWEKWDARDSYRVELQDLSLVIYSARRDEYLLSLRDLSGEVIESIYAESGQTGFETLQAIFEIARRESLDIKGKIDQALAYLKRP